MTTSTLTLSAFLLARIAEDEDGARAATPAPWVVDELDGGGVDVRARRGAGPTVATTVPLGFEERRSNAAHIVRHDPARVLAECEAKRRIVENPHPSPDAHDQWEDVLLTLAEVYADHPDFRQEWRA